jgi:hypothetical protein
VQGRTRAEPFGAGDWHLMAPSVVGAKLADCAYSSCSPRPMYGAAAGRCAEPDRPGPARAGFEAAARGRAAPGGVAAATRALPRDIPSFTGRQRELEQLAEAAAGAGQVVGIHAIGGMAGVGKTAFAVHAAHRLAGRFPGGQIFLQLHVHTPGQLPVDPRMRWPACC